MVESTQNIEQDNFEEEQDKTFVQEPVILDKIKAAATVTDGKHSTLNNHSPLNFLSFSRT